MNLSTCNYLQPFISARVLATPQYQTGIPGSKVAGVCPNVHWRELENVTHTRVIFKFIFKLLSPHALKLPSAYLSG